MHGVCHINPDQEQCCANKANAAPQWMYDQSPSKPCRTVQLPIAQPLKGHSLEPPSSINQYHAAFKHGLAGVSFQTHHGPAGLGVASTHLAHPLAVLGRVRERVPVHARRQQHGRRAVASAQHHRPRRLVHMR